jgi:hypothetical protein
MRPEIHFPRNRLLFIALLSWLSMLGFDFLLHAGLLASLYLRASPFLLPPLRAFQLIPVGYLSLLLLVILLIWLMERQNIRGWRHGFGFGLKVGALSSGAFVLGLWSISSAEPDLLAGWFVGQTIELAIAGAVIGGGLAGERLKRLALIATGFMLACVIVTATLQISGLAPAARLVQ